MPQLNLGGITVDVVLKNIKNVHLTVHPPSGRVRISAPSRMRLDSIRVFAISKLGWIREQQRTLRQQQRETPREYLDRESHHVWGRRYLLKLEETDGPPSVELKHARMLLRGRATSAERRRAVLDAWYREQIKNAVPSLLAKWEPLLGVKVARLFVQRMRTRWGGCNPDRRTIRVNTDLAEKPPECLGYIVVHEMIHLLEPTHNARFVALMDQFVPQWRFRREQLNRLPVRHEDWLY